MVGCGVFDICCFFAVVTFLWVGDAWSAFVEYQFGSLVFGDVWGELFKQQEGV